MTVFFRRRHAMSPYNTGVVYSDDFSNTSFTATLYACDKRTGEELYPVDIEETVYFYIFTKDDGGYGWSYYSKNFDPIRSGIMTKEEGTGVYKATYTTLSSGSYAAFAIVEHYTVLD